MIEESMPHEGLNKEKRMKKALLAVVILGFSAVLASANGLGFFGAYWDTESAGDGIGAGAKLQLEVVPNLLMEFRGTYFEDIGDGEDGEGVDNKLQIIPAEVGLIISFPVADLFKPYAGGGAGYYLADASVEADGMDEDIDIDDEIGYYAVGGIELGLAKNFFLFAEYKYTWVEIDTFIIEDVEFEGASTLDGPGGSAGLLLKW